MADPTPPIVAPTNYNGTVIPLAMRPESVVLKRTMLFAASDMEQTNGPKGRKVAGFTLARYAVPPLIPVTDPSAAEASITQTSGGVEVWAGQPGFVVHLPALADLAEQVAPVLNASQYDVMLASAGDDEPFRVPGVPVGSTMILPAGGSVELRPVATGDPASQGWYLRETMPRVATSVAGRTGDVTLAASDVAGLGTAATRPATDFATAAQGTKADSAVQPGDLAPYATTAAVNAGDATLAAAISAHVGDRTSNPHNVTKAQVGLGNVDNTSDASKPVSVAQQVALDGKANAAHTHPISDVVNLSATLGTLATQASLSAHVNDTGNPHAVTKAQVGLGNADNTADLAKPLSAATQAALNGLAPTVHTHIIGDVANLQVTLDGKSPVGHTHQVADVTGLQSALDAKLAANGNGSSLTGLTAAQVGLGNVNNTSDANKPISTATATALAGKAALAHTHAIADVTGLQSALDGKSAVGHTHAISDVTGLQTALAGKAAVAHTHDAADVVSGLIATARLGTGTANASTYLRGDQTYAAIPSTRTKRVALPTGLLGINLSQTVTVTWPTPFADANYSAVGNLYANGTTVNLATLQVSLKSWDASSATFTVTNVGIALTVTGVMLVAIGVHD